MDAARQRVSGATAVRLALLHLVPAFEGLVGQGLGCYGPEALGRLPCGGVRRQNVALAALWALDLRAARPPGAVEPPQEVRARAGPHRLGDLGQGPRERRARDGGEPGPAGPTSAWRHHGSEVAPLVAMLHDRPRALPAGAPAATQDGREAEAVLIGGPERSGGPWVGLLQGVHDGRPTLLQAAWARRSALAWRGRGP
jgi:hypothetical protein